EAEIDWKQPAKVILNQIRAFNPYPGAYTFVRVKGKKMRLKIWTAHIAGDMLIPDEVQLVGKNRTTRMVFNR
ncbi:MAG: hypothetical protein ABID04_02685, partial [Patescibacteria group bacterium]